MSGQSGPDEIDCFTAHECRQQEGHGNAPHGPFAAIGARQDKASPNEQRERYAAEYPSPGREFSELPLADRIADCVEQTRGERELYCEEGRRHGYERNDVAWGRAAASPRDGCGWPRRLPPGGRLTASRCPERGGTLRWAAGTIGSDAWDLIALAVVRPSQRVAGSPIADWRTHSRWRRSIVGTLGGTRRWCARRRLFNVLQRDVCPSATRFEGEIIAMGLDLLHADAVSDDGEPVGLVTSGGSGSILHAVLSYREYARADTRHRPPQLREARDRPPRVRQGVPPARRRAARSRRSIRTTATVDVDAVAPAHRRQHDRDHGLGRATTATAPSTRSPSSPTLALERGVGLHVDGCLGGFILPWGQELGYDIPLVRLPRSRRHDDLGRHAQVRLRLQGHVGARCSATRRCATASTSSRPTGPAASTARPASTARARAACSPRRGRRW